MVGIGFAMSMSWALSVVGDDGKGASHIGRPATEEDIHAWNIDISPTGEGLPPGQGTVSRGAAVYAAKCAGCHGPTGIEGPMTKLVCGQRTLATDKPIKTIGSFWPYATTLFDYIFRAMPYTAPQSLTPDEIYSVIAWLLHRNGIVPEDTVIDAKTLPRIHMPNQESFVSDPRPDVHQP
jgi:hypothetical protein